MSERCTVNSKWTDVEWAQECTYISRVTSRNGRVSEMNNDPAVFKRYCEMQRNSAQREGRDDVVAYIEQCIDDMKGE